MTTKRDVPTIASKNDPPALNPFHGGCLSPIGLKHPGRERMTVRSRASVFASRRLLALIFARHHSALSLGQVPCKGQPCQKHPSRLLRHLLPSRPQVKSGQETRGSPFTLSDPWARLRRLQDVLHPDLGSSAQRARSQLAQAASTSARRAARSMRAAGAARDVRCDCLELSLPHRSASQHTPSR